MLLNCFFKFHSLSDFRATFVTESLSSEFSSLDTWNKSIDWVGFTHLFDDERDGLIHFISGEDYACNRCGRQFKNEYSRRRHEANDRLHESMERSIQDCFVCGLRLAR